MHEKARCQVYPVKGHPDPDTRSTLLKDIQIQIIIYIYIQIRSMHEKARCQVYPVKGHPDKVTRFQVPDDKVYIFDFIRYDKEQGNEIIECCIENFFIIFSLHNNNVII
jgi:hypothetical protein